ncbi:Uncharacterized protein APZ42_003023, partial [Daphnia magna]
MEMDLCNEAKMLKMELVSARRSRRVETVTATSQWDYPGPLIGSLNRYTL